MASEGNDLALGYMMGNDSNNNCRNDGWGADGGWLWLLVIFALLGFGGNGWGNWGGNGSGLQGVFATQADIQRGFDTSTIIGKLDGISNGICDSTFALNNTIVNGFNGVQRDMCTGFSNINAGINATQVAMMQGFNAAQAQAADCCYKTQTNIMQLGNQVERGFCQTNFNDQVNTTAIIQNAHNDTDRVIAKLDAMEMSRKDETIAALRSQVDALNLAQSQANQNNYLVSQLAPKCPVPAFLTCNPYTGQTYTNGYGYGYGYNQGCGQGCGCNSCGC